MEKQIENSCGPVRDWMKPILDQANKSTGWMPWHQEPKKDVASCEKPWGAASKH